MAATLSFGTGIQCGGQNGEGWTTQEVVDRMTDSTAYIVYRGDEAVATISLQSDDPKSWGEQPPNALYLHRLAVKVGMNGQNLGGQMIEWAARQAVAQGRAYIRLDCPADNKDLCTYYEGYVAALYERPAVPAP